MIQKNSVNTIVKYIKEIDLPKLKGTQRQVEWANNIRKDIIDNIYTQVAMLVSILADEKKLEFDIIGQVTSSDTDFYHLVGVKLSKSNVENFLIYVKNIDVNYLKKFFDEIFKNDSAKFWIDNFKNKLSIPNFVFRILLYKKILEEHKQELTHKKSFEDKIDLSDLPEIIGSEKQVKWATNIRNNLMKKTSEFNINDVFEYIDKIIYNKFYQRSNDICKKELYYFINGDDNLDYEESKKIRNNAKKHLQKWVKKSINEMFKYITDSKDYINKRNESIEYFIALNTIYLILKECSKRNSIGFLNENKKYTSFYEMFIT